MGSALKPAFERPGREPRSERYTLCIDGRPLRDVEVDDTGARRTLAEYPERRPAWMAVRYRPVETGHEERHVLEAMTRMERVRRLCG